MHDEVNATTLRVLHVPMNPLPGGYGLLPPLAGAGIGVGALGVDLAQAVSAAALGGAPHGAAVRAPEVPGYAVGMLPPGGPPVVGHGANTNTNTNTKYTCDTGQTEHGGTEPLDTGRGRRGHFFLRTGRRVCLGMRRLERPVTFSSRRLTRPGCSRTLFLPPQRKHMGVGSAEERVTRGTPAGRRWRAA